MIECALAIPSHQKRMGLRLILTLIEFSQLFVQVCVLFLSKLNREYG